VDDLMVIVPWVVFAVIAIGAAVVLLRRYPR
jgi:hypothetical protein